MFRCSILVAAVVMLGAPLLALAGDDVDYSAPYLTLENGELVTRYPLKDHTAGAASETASAEPTIESQQPAEQARLTWVLAGGAIAVVVLGLLLAQRRRQRSDLS